MKRILKMKQEAKHFCSLFKMQFPCDALFLMHKSMMLIIFMYLAYSNALSLMMYRKRTCHEYT